MPAEDSLLRSSPKRVVYEKENVIFFKARLCKSTRYISKNYVNTESKLLGDCLPVTSAIIRP